MLSATELAVGFIPDSRKNVTEADIQDQEEVDDHARDRYQRMYWEPVAETEVRVNLLLSSSGKQY